MSNLTVPAIFINHAGSDIMDPNDLDTFQLSLTQVFADANAADEVISIPPADAPDGDDVLIDLYTRPVPSSTAGDNAPVPADEGYGNFLIPAVQKLFEDLCTADAQKTHAATYWGLEVGEAGGGDVKAGPESTKAFAHYATQAIIGLINNLEITIELTADATAASTSTSTTVSTAGSATAQTGTGSGTTDITSAIEASTFTVTLSTKT